MSALWHALFLAGSYLRAVPGRSVVLIMGTTIALFLPRFTWDAADLMEASLLARAEASPILLGHKGNEFDLTLNALYFRGAIKDPIPFSASQRVTELGYGLAIPLYVVHSVSGAPLVGTSLDYFTARELSFSSGRAPAVLGEVVAGSAAADAFQLRVGDTVRSDLTNLYNIAGSYPVLLDVVGILSPSNTPDDGAFFADIKTIWVLDGQLHGHETVSSQNSLNPDAEEEENLEATAAIFMFSENNDGNRGSFHFHGQEGQLPISSVLVIPDSQRHHDQLLGDYSIEEDWQAIRPVEVITAILDIVLRVREGLAAYFAVVAASTLAFFVLAISLSLRLRQEELALMRRIGGSPARIAAIVGVEIGLVIASSVILSVLLSAGGLHLLRTVLTGGPA